MRFLRLGGYKGSTSIYRPFTLLSITPPNNDDCFFFLQLLHKYSNTEATTKDKQACRSCLSDHHAQSMMCRLFSVSHFYKVECHIESLMLFRNRLRTACEAIDYFGFAADAAGALV